MSHVRALVLNLPSKPFAELNFHALRLRVKPDRLVERALDQYFDGNAPESGR